MEIPNHVPLLRQAHAAAAMGGKHDAGVMPRTSLIGGTTRVYARENISFFTIVQGNTP